MPTQRKTLKPFKKMKWQELAHNGRTKLTKPLHYSIFLRLAPSVSHTVTNEH